MKIEELIYNIKNNEIVVPEFQREFVWGNDRVKSLISSLMNEYPVGGILLWKTNKPPSLKGPINENIDPNRAYQSTTVATLAGQMLIDLEVVINKI